MSQSGLGRIILACVIAGPPAGLVALLLSISGFEMMRPGGQPIGLANAVNGLPLLVPLAYIMGALPAILTSFAMAVTWERGWGFAARLAAAPVIGAVASCLCWIFLGPDGAVSKWMVLTTIAVAGAVAAVFSTLLLEAWSRRKKTA
jgi:hypothetical protein